MRWATAIHVLAILAVGLAIIIVSEIVVALGGGRGGWWLPAVAAGVAIPVIAYALRLERQLKKAEQSECEACHWQGQQSELDRVETGHGSIQLACPRCAHTVRMSSA